MPRPGPHIEVWMKTPGSFSESVDDACQYIKAVAESTDGVYSVPSGWFTEVTRDVFAHIGTPGHQPPAKSAMIPTA